MEKQTPHCKLSIVKALIAEDKIRLTNAARTGATALGVDLQGVIAILLNLSANDFYKSMTTHADHTIWQDVYKPSTMVGEIYLKLTVLDDVLLVSFKEL